MGRPYIERVKKTCKFCGQEFEVYPRKPDQPFCNRQCYFAWLDAQRPRVQCASCGKIFATNPAQVKEFNFCDRRCTAEWRKENWKGKDAPQYTGRRAAICPECGKEFEQVNMGQVTCSFKCRGKRQSRIATGSNANNWRGGSVETKCAQCGRTILRNRHEFERSEKHFCDPECLGKWRSDNIVGPNHPNWRGGWEYDYGPNWEEQREKARERDDYICQACSATKIDIGQNPDAHHIIPFREFGYIPAENDNYLQANQLDNLVCLCPSCHKKADWDTL